MIAICYQLVGALTHGQCLRSGTGFNIMKETICCWGVSHISQHQISLQMIMISLQYLVQGWCGLHCPGAGHNVAADHDVGVHLGVTVWSDAGHQVGEGGELSLGDRGLLHHCAGLDLESITEQLGRQSHWPLIVTSHIVRLSLL